MFISYIMKVYFKGDETIRTWNNNIVFYLLKFENFIHGEYIHNQYGVPNLNILHL